MTVREAATDCAQDGSQKKRKKKQRKLTWGKLAQTAVLASRSRGYLTCIYRIMIEKVGTNRLQHCLFSSYRADGEIGHSV